MWLQRKLPQAILLWLVLLCCLIAGNLHAQVVAKIGFDSISTCPPFKAQFIDSSLGEPDIWYWDFDNGETSTLQNNTVTYNAPGYYTVKLKVQKGLSVDSTFRTVYVLGANASFDYTYSNICSVPATFHFIVDTLLSTANYHWTFSDGNISIVPNPTRVFTAGKYKISLQTISEEGCIDSASTTIQIGDVKADFLAPQVVCINDTTVFTNISGVKPLAAVWTINGIVFKTGSGNASYRFTSPGTYTIGLAEDFGSCRDQLKRNIVVYDKPTASFSASGTLQSCTYPSTVQFNNSSSNATAYKWFFGDGDSSMEFSPTHTYAIAGQFSPVLIAYNVNGCPDTLIKEGMILLGPPVVNAYTGIPTSGCIPFDVAPLLTVSSPELIASYNWNFGDGSFSNEANPIHTYTKFGKYDISVSITTVNGCSTVLTIPNAVIAGRVSTPSFTADKTVVCGNEEVHFTGTATGNVTTWIWNLTDTITKTQSPTFRFKKAGYKTITLAANNNGCVTKVTKANYIYVKPPFSAKSITYDCINKLRVQFKDNSQQALSWSWNFGDGTSSVLQNPPAHMYSTSGEYLVTLTTTNGECSNIDSSFIAVSNDRPVFTYDPPDGYICPGGNITIGVTNSSFIQDYSWSFGDGVQMFSDTSVQYAYSKKGSYYPSLTIKYTNGCIDSAFSKIPVVVNAPTAIFTIEDAVICAMDTARFTESSKSDGIHEIVTRLWQFGDSQQEVINTEPYLHPYNNAGNYAANLIITDENHCSDTAVQSLVVNELPPISAGVDSFVCVGNIIQLQASGAATYHWENTASLSCFNCAAPLAAPLQSATYYVTGTGSNSCHAQDSVYIKVVQPFTLEIPTESLAICNGKSVELKASGTDLYTWEPAATLSDATISNPIASPSTNTTYTVKATDSTHCFMKTGTVSVQVHSKPEITIENSLLEVEEGTQTIINTTSSPDVSNWAWSPPSGLSCINCLQPVVTAKDNITYTAIASTQYGCSDTATLTVHILCNSSKIWIPTGFTPNGDGINDRFYIHSSSKAPLRSLVIYTRYGNRVFIKQNGITNNAGDGWDGFYNGLQMPPGVYVFMAEVICNGQPIPLKGTVTLMR